VIRLALAFLLLSGSAAWSEAGPVASDWVRGMNNAVRLIAGHASRDGQAGLYAGVDVSMPGGWKTYWRTPGDAGGVPPDFDWKASDNLASATVLYPAPYRIHDKAGDVVGYENAVLFPVLLTPIDPAKPITLNGKVQYGICKDICIPAEAELQLTIPPDIGSSPELTEILTRVPSVHVHPGIDPSLAAWHLDQNTGKPKLVLDVASADPKSADAFVEGPGGIYVPLPKRRTDQFDSAVFEVDLTDGVNIKDLKGKPLTVTIVDAKGQSETTITLE
jgi:DsbC/DsbD-like thiol-disulfide interchange protein